MNELLAIGIFGDTMSTLKTILAMCVVLGVIYLLVTIPQLRPILAVVFAVVFVFFGVSATYHNLVYLSTNNMTVGQVINSYMETTKVETTKENTGKPIWNLKNFGFSNLSDNTFESTIILDPCTEIDFLNKKYALYVNNELCLYNEVGIDYVKSRFNYTFYDDYGNTILTDTLHINFAFNANETKLVLRTLNGQSAVNLWKSFQAKNNMVLELKVSDYATPTFEGLDIMTGPYAIYNFENGTLYGYTIDINSTYDGNFTLPSTIAQQQLAVIETGAFEGLSTAIMYFDGTSLEFENIQKANCWNAITEENYIEQVVCQDNTLYFDSEGNILTYTEEEEISNTLTCYYNDGSVYTAEMESIVLTANDIPNKENLIKIEIADSTVELEDKFYTGATNLQTIHFGANVAKIGVNGLPNCQSFSVNENNKHFVAVNGVLYSNDKTIIYRYPSKSTNTSYTILDGVTTIYANCFATCEQSLTKIVLPDSITTIQARAFIYCLKLTDINLPENITQINSYTFYGCGQLTTITLPKFLNTIKSQAFAYCVNLEEINITGIVLNKIETSAFTQMDDLTVNYCSLKLNFKNNTTLDDGWYYPNGIGDVATVVCSDGTLTYNHPLANQ